MEVITAVKRDGTLMKTVIHYDIGAENSCLTDSLAAKSATASVKGGFSINTIGGRANSDSKAHTIRLKDAEGKTIAIDGLGVSGKWNKVEKMQVRVPPKWRKHVRRSSYMASGGNVDLFLQLDGRG